MEVKRLIPYHFLQELLSWLEVVPRPVELSWALIVRQLDINEEFLKVWMLEAVLHGVPLLRVKYEHLLEQAVSIRVCFWEYLLHCLLVLR